jgi:mRNA interferase RelE/StbE
VLLTPEAQRQFLALPVTIQQRVREVLQRLTTWPEVSGAKPLKGELKGSYRVRTGDWRVVFRPSGDDVLVTRIANRKDVYED